MEKQSFFYTYYKEMDRDCHRRFTEHFPNDKIIFLSAHGWVFKHPEDKGSDFSRPLR
jgi:hypothetical protein